MLLVIVSVQVREVPVHAPAQPIHGDPGSGVAVKVTTVPAAKDAPVGLVVTVPFPVLPTVSLKVDDVCRRRHHRHRSRRHRQRHQMS